MSALDPARDEKGQPIERFPHLKYRSQPELPLNKYGNGPFCKFRIPLIWSGATGVYIISVDGIIRYMGYGHISPRNCYVGGQNTNCKINNLVLQTGKSGSISILWFHPTQDRFAVEARLIRELRPEWNGRS